MSLSIKKTKKKHAIRKRRCSSSDEESSDNIKSICEIIEQTQEVQKNRMKQNGVSSESLFSGKVFKNSSQQDENEGYNLSTGGCTDAKTLKKEMINDEMKSIGTSFAAETNQRDEDTEMLKYVDRRMAERKGYNKQISEESKVNKEDKLYELPERLKLITSKIKKSEDMLSHQMLSGIPEIQLGITQKIKNIEATEDAKMKMIRESREKQDNSMQKYVPTNMAVNFMQHNRFKVDETVPSLNDGSSREQDIRLPGRALIAKDVKSEKCTDDFHFDKFRNKVMRK